MRIIFAGTPEYAVPSLRALVDAGHQVVGVLTRADAPIGRKRVMTPSPLASAADELGIPTRKTNRIDDAAASWIADLAPELGVIVAYGGLVREPVLSTPDLGWVNLHFSELPRWRGAAPVQRALQAGEQRLGVTVFRLVEALDAGPVLSRDGRDFPAGTTSGEALTELSDFGTAALLVAIDALAADPAAGEPQTGESSYARKLVRDDGRIDPRLSNREVLAHWAGVTPEPGAFALVDGEPLKLLALRSIEDASASAVHAGIARIVSRRALLRTGDGDLELVTVQPAGKAAMDGAAWLRGRGGEAVLS